MKVIKSVPYFDYITETNGRKHLNNHCSPIQCHWAGVVSLVYTKELRTISDQTLASRIFYYEKMISDYVAQGQPVDEADLIVKNLLIKEHKRRIKTSKQKTMKGKW